MLAVFLYEFAISLVKDRKKFLGGFGSAKKVGIMIW